MSTSSNTDQIARNASILMVSQIITWILALLLTLIQPRLLGTAGLGELHVAQSVWAVATVFIMFGMDVLLMKEIARTPERAGQLFSTGILIQIPLYLIGAGAVALWTFIAGYSYNEILTVAILGVGILIWQFALMMRASLLAIEQVRIVSYGEIAGKVFSTFVGITVLLMGYGVIGMALVNVGMALTNLVVQWVYFRRFSTFTFDVDLSAAAELLRAGVPYMLSGFFLAAYTQIDAIVLKQLLSVDAVGWYSASDRIYGTMQFVPTAFIGATFPMMARMYAQDRQAMPKMMQRSFNLMMVLGFPIGFGLFAMAQPLVNLLYGAEYEKSGSILATMGIVVVVMYLTSLIGRFLISADRQNTWTIIMAVAVVAAVGLDLLLIPFFQNFMNNGAIGGAAAYIITESGMLLAGILMVPKGSLNRGNLWAFCKTLTAGVLMLAAVWPVRNFYMNATAENPEWYWDVLIVLPIVVGAVSYILLILFFRLIPATDWQIIGRLLPARLARFIPFGRRSADSAPQAAAESETQSADDNATDQVSIDLTVDAEELLVPDQPKDVLF